jgi:hypothetical protein
MPTSTLTWSTQHGDSALQSTFSTTSQGAIQLINAYLTTLQGFSDFPWEVCSFEGTTAPWFVTLKRKNATPGRIVFVGVTTAPNTTYNPQFGTISWGVSGIRAAYFRDATSDTPANILATSGDVFTNPTNPSGMSPNLTMSSGTSYLTGWGCDAGIALRYGPSTSPSGLFLVGDFLEDNAGELGPSVSFMSSSASLETMNPSASPSVNNSGGFSLVSGQNVFFGNGFVQQVSLSSNLRDNATKRAWFLPRGVCSYQLPFGEMTKYKIRQVAFGPTPIAANETLVDTGAVLKAVSTAATTTTGFPWLTNDKV